MYCALQLLQRLGNIGTPSIIFHHPKRISGHASKSGNPFMGQMHRTKGIRRKKNASYRADVKEVNYEQNRGKYTILGAVKKYQWGLRELTSATL